MHPWEPRNSLLRLLGENRERYVSGAAMAQAHRREPQRGVESRRGALRAEVRRRRARTRALSPETSLSPQGIEQFLPPATPSSRAPARGLLASEARRRAAESAPEGAVIVAEEQTAGKGRPGKTFFSPASSGLYLSIVLRPTLAADRGQFLTCAAAVAARRPSSR